MLGSKSSTTRPPPRWRWTRCGRGCAGRAGRAGVGVSPGRAGRAAAAEGQYPLPHLEEHGLVTEVGRRRWGRADRRLLHATAAAYVVSPRRPRRGLGDPDRIADRLSARYLIALAARVVREVAGLAAGPTGPASGCRPGPRHRDRFRSAAELVPRSPATWRTPSPPWCPGTTTPAPPAAAPTAWWWWPIPLPSGSSRRRGHRGALDATTLPRPGRSISRSESQALPSRPGRRWPAAPGSPPGSSRPRSTARVDGTVGEAGLRPRLRDRAGRITAWCPRRFVAEVAAEGRPVFATEWLVEARDGGTCVVRLIHSGFGTAPSWTPSTTPPRPAGGSSCSTCACS